MWVPGHVGIAENEATDGVTQASGGLRTVFSTACPSVTFTALSEVILRHGRCFCSHTWGLGVPPARDTFLG